MGQYHTIVAFDNDPNVPAETIEHYPLGAGAKLGEQFYAWQHEVTEQQITSPYTLACALMIGSVWRDKRIMVIGDYSDGMGGDWFDYPGEPFDYYGGAKHSEGLLVDRTDMAKGLVGEALGYSFDDTVMKWSEIVEPDDLVERIDKLTRRQFKNDDSVLVSLQAGEYLDPLKLRTTPDPLIAAATGFLWPCALAMTAISDGNGGGDWRMDPAGRWAYSRIGWLPRVEAQRAELFDVTGWALEQNEMQYAMSHRW